MRAGAVDYLRWPFAARVLDRVFQRVTEGNNLRLLQEGIVRAQGQGGRAERARDGCAHSARQGPVQQGDRARAEHQPPHGQIHRANMMSKLGAHSSGDAVRIGVHAGLDEATGATELLAA